ncbi:hypothetical protein [Sutcliffiella deserti]|uniref:hypothetical protein n=1 Tax=Sutcliffiella deserti TaxID=2875501 RepID=UPI001CBA7CBC|nr:hypothetical protein [Sutcliffiella deserti]
MIKGNSYVLILTLIICITLFSFSSTPNYIKGVMIFFSALLFFPVFRAKLTQDSFRKVKVALLTSMMLPSVFMVDLFTLSSSSVTSFTFYYETIMGSLIVLLLFGFYGSIGTILYGIPASIFTDYFSSKYGGQIRIIISGFLHIGFGFAAYFIVPEYLLLTVVASFIFYMVDEIAKWVYHHNTWLNGEVT